MPQSEELEQHGSLDNSWNLGHKEGSREASKALPYSRKLSDKNWESVFLLTNRKQGKTGRMNPVFLA